MPKKKEFEINKGNHVIGYIRVSTDGQCGDDKFGMAEQKSQIENYCKEHKLEIVKWVYDEGESGAYERENFDEIVYSEEYCNPPTAAVVVAKSDRVARDMMLYFYYKMLLRKKGMEIISVGEDFSVFGEYANLLESFTLFTAEMERKNITIRTSGGRKQKAMTGGYSGGNAPFGYSIKDGEYVINPKEAELVREVFRLRDKKGASYGAIASALENAGYRGRSGNPIHRSNIRGIYINRMTYLGYYHYGDMDEWVKGKHEPILSDEYLPEDMKNSTTKAHN